MEDTIADVMREIIGNRTQRDVAAAAEVDQATIHNLLRGKRVSYDITVKIARGLQLKGPLRRRFFTALSYADPDPGLEAAVEALLETATEQPEELTYASELESLDVRAFRGGDKIPDHDAEVLNRILRTLRTEQLRRQGRS